MKLRNEDIEKMKKLSPKEFQEKVLPNISLKLFFKVLIKHSSDKQIYDILKDYYDRDMEKEYLLFLKMCRKRKRKIPDFVLS